MSKVKTTKLSKILIKLENIENKIFKKLFLYLN